MQRMKITAGHQQVMPYIVLRNAEEFIDFTRKIFRAEEMMRVLNADKKIQHAEIKIGDSIMLLAEATATYPPKPGALYVYVQDTTKPITMP